MKTYMHAMKTNKYLLHENKVIEFYQLFQSTVQLFQMLLKLHHHTNKITEPCIIQIRYNTVVPAASACPGMPCEHMHIAPCTVCLVHGPGLYSLVQVFVVLSCVFLAVAVLGSCLIFACLSHCIITCRVCALPSLV